MTITFSISVIFLMVGIVVGLFTSFILFFEKTNKKANFYLAFLVIICVGSLFHNFLIESKIYNQKNELYFLPVIFSLGIGPFLFLYVRTLLNNTKINTSKLFLHLLPLLIQFVVYLVCFVQNTEDKYNIYSKIYEPLINPIQNIAVYFSVAFYLYLAFIEIRKYKQLLNNFYSNSDRIAMLWLKKILYVFMGYYILSIFFLIISYSFKSNTNYFPSDFIRYVIIFIIAIFAIKQNSLIDIQHNIKSVVDDKALEANIEADVEEVKEILNNEHIKLENEPTKPKEVNTDILQKIIAIVEKEKLYLNENLTIADIASKLGYSTKTISTNINNGLGKSFSFFINEYRVNLFKERRSSGKYDNLSIMGLAYDCGFNSKSTFNRIFKEITGFLPKQKNN